MIKCFLTLATFGLITLGACNVNADTISTNGGSMLTPMDVSQFFMAPGEACTLKWIVADASVAGQLDYTISDYESVQCGAGKVQVSPAGEADLPVTLATGYYEIKFSQTGQSFGLTVLPSWSGKPDPFFCMDAGLSWLEPRRSIRESIVPILERTGIAMVRERFSWGQIEPRVGQFDLQTPRNYEALRETYLKHNIEVLDLLDGAPAWAEPTAKNPFPGNLNVAGSQITAIAQKWSPYWNALEVWNEPNQGATIPADQYVPLVKTVSFDFKTAKQATLVGGGVFGEFNRAYVRQALRNGLAADSNFISFHDYAEATFLQGEVEEYRSLLKEAGREGMPLWLTECGWAWTSGPPRPDAQEGSVSALQIAMKAVEAKACGISRFFPFVYTNYLEPPKSFGMMGKEVTPLRAMAAYAQVVRMLSGKSYIGDLRVTDASIKRARAFSDGKRAVVVVYIGKPEAGRVVKLPIDVKNAQGADGRVLASSGAGMLAVPNGIAYVLADASGIAGSLIKDTTAARLLAASHQKSARLRLASPIVLQNLIDRNTVAPSLTGYAVAPSAVASVPLSIKITNLADEEITASLHLDVDGSAVGAAQSAKLGSHASTTLRWDIDLSKTSTNVDGSIVTVSGVDSKGVSIAPLSLSLAMEHDLPTYLVKYPASSRIDLSDLSAWKSNISGNGQMKMSVTPDNHWLLSSTFGTGSTWVYPILALPASMDLSKADGLLVRARLTGSGHAYFLLDKRNGSIYAVSNIIPPDGQWHTRYLPFAEFAALGAAKADVEGKLILSEVRSVQIGASDTSQVMDLEVSDLYGVFGQK